MCPSTKTPEFLASGGCSSVNEMSECERYAMHCHGMRQDGVQTDKQAAISDPSKHNST
jgi:hypothetical protein